VAKLRYRKVGREGSLLSLFADDTNAYRYRGLTSVAPSTLTSYTRTDIGSLDHAHVIPTISNAADTLLSVAPDKPGDVCFLRRGAPAGDDGGELGCDLYKLVLEQVKAEL
jgi:hypothetical protein